MKKKLGALKIWWYPLLLAGAIFLYVGWWPAGLVAAAVFLYALADS